jgi:hypothetical protein
VSINTSSLTMKAEAVFEMLDINSIFVFLYLTIHHYIHNFCFVFLCVNLNLKVLYGRQNSKTCFYCHATVY